MTSTVYVLGAGFSAPLGLPLMSNFLSRSKDMYIENEKRYAHFSEVFDAITEMSAAKNNITADLHNIEEILSIMEMNDFLGNHSTAEKYIAFLKDVIAYHTPEIKVDMAEVIRTIDADWLAKIIGTDRKAYYFCFLLNLLQLKIFHFPRSENMAVVGTRRNDSDESFGLISLNYDMVIEKIISVINATASGGLSPMPAELKLKKSVDGVGELAFAKLHGSVESQIVAPTWNKGRAESIRDTWKLAYEMLSGANHIRFIGYSLPTTDNYVKYLFTAALSKSFRVRP